MNEIYISGLLYIVQNRLSIDKLLDLGLDYSQIANLLSELFEKGLIVDANEKGIILTDQGKNLLEKLPHAPFSINKSKWILPAEKYRIKKIDKFDVYLPGKKS